MNTTCSSRNRMTAIRRGMMTMALGLAVGGGATPASAATNNIIGTYANWPTNWVPVNALNDPDDGLANV